MKSSRTTTHKTVADKATDERIAKSLEDIARTLADILVLMQERGK